MDRESVHEEIKNVGGEVRVETDRSGRHQSATVVAQEHENYEEEKFESHTESRSHTNRIEMTEPARESTQS